MAGQTSIGATALYLSADDSEFQEGLDRADKGFARYRRKLESDAAATHNSLKGHLDFSDLAKLTGVGLAVGGIQSAFSGLSSLFTDFVTDSLKMSASFETTQMSFEVMLGSADKAKKLFDDIKEFAVHTPMTASEISDAAKQLLNAGVAGDQIIATLRVLGDVAQGDGERLKEMSALYGKVRLNGRVNGEEMRQFVHQSVPLTEALAQVMGKSAAEIHGLVEEGKVGFPELQRALISLTGDGGRFKDMMERQSQTTAGLFSTLRDNWEQLEAKFGDILIDEFGLKDVLVKLSDATGWTKDNLDGIRPIVHDVAILVKEIAKDLVTGAVEFARQIARAADDIGEIRGGAKDAYDSAKDFASDGLVSRIMSWAGRELRGPTPADLGLPEKHGAAADNRGPREKAFDDALKGLLAKLGTGDDLMKRLGLAGSGGSFWQTMKMAADAGDKGVSFWTKANQLAIEASQLTADQIKHVKSLREAADPFFKAGKGYDDLAEIRRRGGFDKPGILNAAMRAGGIGGIDNELFRFAMGQFANEIMGHGALKTSIGAAVSGSSEAASAIAEATNQASFNSDPQAVMKRGFEELKRINQRQADNGAELIRLLQKMKVIPAF